MAGRSSKKAAPASENSEESIILANTEPINENESIESAEDSEEDEPIEDIFKYVKIESLKPRKVKLEQKQEQDEETFEFDDRPTEKILNADIINKSLKEIEYAPLGSMENRVAEIEAILDDDDDYEFDRILKGNDDDAHYFGQEPLTFLRQVLAAICYPKLLESPLFPDDVKIRAHHIIKGCRGGSIGSVTDPAGIITIRKHVAQFIKKRDGFPSKWGDIVLTAGICDAINMIFTLINCDTNGKKIGVMIPVPSVELYRVNVAKQNMYQINYYLNEDNNWSIDTDELNRAYQAAKSECHPRAILVVSPGIPTGQILERESIEEIIKFAYTNKLLICVDEMHQLDIYTEEIEFVSFKKVLKEMGPPHNSMELASFMSASASYMSEHALQGGYIEFINVAPEVKEIYLNYISTRICPPVLGQAAIEVLVNPPLPGEPSFINYFIETKETIDLYKMRAEMVTVAFNNFLNFKCTPILSGTHAFPRIYLSEEAIADAEELELLPDFFYTSELLEQKGVCVTPGNKYGQKEDTYHFCIALVLPPDDLEFMLGSINRFNKKFTEKYLCKCKKKKSEV